MKDKYDQIRWDNFKVWEQEECRTNTIRYAEIILKSEKRRMQDKYDQIRWNNFKVWEQEECRTNTIRYAEIILKSENKKIAGHIRSDLRWDNFKVWEQEECRTLDCIRSCHSINFNRKSNWLDHYYLSSLC